jgi:mitochondrial import receptor subunit TOM40
MASTSLTEKPGAIDLPSQSASEPRNSLFLRPFTPFANVYHRFAQWRTDLNLPNPGTVENLQKEVKGASFARSSAVNADPSTPLSKTATHLTNFAFDGGRADLTKTLSMTPAFQVTHSFALGSQTVPPSYNFGAIFATPLVLVVPPTAMTRPD